MGWDAFAVEVVEEGVDEENRSVRAGVGGDVMAVIAAGGEAGRGVWRPLQPGIPHPLFLLSGHSTTRASIPTGSVFWLSRCLILVANSPGAI